MKFYENEQIINIQCLENIQQTLRKMQKKTTTKEIKAQHLNVKLLFI